MNLILPAYFKNPIDQIATLDFFKA